MSRATKQHGRADDLLARLAHNLRAKCRVADGARVLVGVSGGCDSVALLCALTDLAVVHRLHLVAAHFDHRLRPDSGKDAQFVVELAAQLGIESCVATWEEPRPGEAAARRARHAFLAEAAQRHDCDVVALAHHVEDQVETVLMRLGRGTGPRGLAGMAWRRAGGVDIVRPLLDCRRERLESYLLELEQPWRHDSTNDDPAQVRNRVRHGVLPALEQTFGASSLESWTESLDDLRALWDYAHAAAVELLAHCRRRSPLAERGRTELCDLAPLREAPSAVCAAALQDWFEAVGCQNLRRQHIQAAVDLVGNGQSGHCVGLPGAAKVCLEQDTLALHVPPAGAERVADPAVHPAAETAKPLTLERRARTQVETRLSVEMAQRVPRRAQIVRESTRVVRPDALPAEMIAWVDADRIAPAPWEVRAARPGDRVRLLGAPGSRTLGRIFQDRRIPRRARATWPIVLDAEGIVWVPGVGVAARARVRNETRHAARLTLRTRSLRHIGEQPASDAAVAAPNRGEAARALITPAAGGPTPATEPSTWGG